jgi:hypothetical protein
MHPARPLKLMLLGSRRQHLSKPRDRGAMASCHGTSVSGMSHPSVREDDWCGGSVCERFDKISPSAASWWGMPMVRRLLAPRSVWLQGADLRWVAAGASLYITSVHMTILGPAGPSIRVDRGVFQDQLPRMRGVHSAPQLDSCRFEAAWWHPVISSRAPLLFLPLIVSQNLASNAVPNTLRGVCLGRIGGRGLSTNDVRRRWSSGVGPAGGFTLRPFL